MNKKLLFCLIAFLMCSCSPKTDNTADENNSDNSVGNTTVSDDANVVNAANDTVKPADANGTANPANAAVDNANVEIADTGVGETVQEKAESVAGDGKSEVIRCGEAICQYKEECKDNQCKTAFEMGVYLAPIPKEGTVLNDGFDYWECMSEKCSYQFDEKTTYSIPKGIRVREGMAYCGGEGIELKRMAAHQCTKFGWICASGECGACETKDCRWNSCAEETCSPGEKCDNGCSFVANSLENVSLCENGDCECGSNRCGKNQICANGDCYFAGDVRNGFGDCAFEIDTGGVCGTSDPPNRLVRYSCPKRCVAEIPPQNKDEYEFQTKSVGDCNSMDVGVWVCTLETGCACGNSHCQKDEICTKGNCAVIKDVDVLPEEAELCADEYLIVIRQPKITEHYIRIGDRKCGENRWKCDSDGECICNGKKLPDGSVCVVEENSIEHVNGCEWSYCWPPPKDIAHYIKDIEHYICDGTFWVCTNEECICAGQAIPLNARCINDRVVCGYDAKPVNLSGYQCDGNKWICPGGDCICDGVKLSEGVECDWNSGEHLKCGSQYLTGQTAKQYKCVDGNWVSTAEDGQAYCRGKILPKGTMCKIELGHSKGEAAQCGGIMLYDWDDYECVDGEWKCTLKDKSCLCDGKPLPDGATCIGNEAYCGYFRESWDGFECRDGKWMRLNEPVNENNEVKEDSKKEDSNLSGKLCEEEQCQCYYHEIGKGVICPNYDRNDYSFTDDIVMSEQESCEHVRGCLCHDKLCPPSGVCTKEGCLDPLTNKLFESKDGYLVSGELRQCSQKDGCKCGETTIEYRDYCYRDEQYISLKSHVNAHKRIICENNYSYWECEEDDASFINSCQPDSYIDPSQYFIRDCMKATRAFYSDRDYEHSNMNECARKEGCECIHNTCKLGEACYKGQCIPDYPCHRDNEYGDTGEEFGKCRPIDPRG